MSSGPAHYQAAETWLLRAERAAGTGTAGSSAAIGIGHAVLALAAAAAIFLPLDRDERVTADEEAWHDVAAVAVAGPEVTP